MRGIQVGQLHGSAAGRGPEGVGGAATGSCCTSLVSHQVTLDSTSGLSASGHTTCTLPSRSSRSWMSAPKRSVMPAAATHTGSGGEAAQ